MSSDNSPLQLSEYSHVGWIPCISGHLDFCLMSVGLSGSFSSNFERPQERHTVNFSQQGEADTHFRRIALESWVDWRDVKKANGQLKHFVVAEASFSDNLDERSLTGKFLIYPRDYEKSFPGPDTQLMTLVRSLDATLKEYKELPAFRRDMTWPATQEALNKKWLELRQQICSPTPLGPGAERVYVIDFHITHSGFAYLKYSPAAADEDSPLGEQSQYLLMRQAYYYLKYSLHKHNHHTEEADSLTTIIPNRPEDNVVGLKILGQLKRELLRIKRTQRKTGRLHDDSEALGILAYMRSLLRSALEEGLLDKVTYKRERDWMRGVRGSFSAQHDAIISKSGRLSGASQTARQWTGISLAYVSLSCLIWLRLHGASASAQSTPASEDFLFGIAAGGSLKLAVAFVFVGVGIWLVNYCIRWLTLADTWGWRLRILKNLSWAPWVAIALAVPGALALALYATLP